MFGTKEDMKVQAEERIVDLKERGFESAGLYDPAGVGGTHVMYVLHHADQPGLYHGLPKDPRISPFVRIWKGIAKPIALAGIAFAALAGFFHYTRIGPNEVSTADELEAHDELERVRNAQDGDNRDRYPRRGAPRCLIPHSNPPSPPCRRCRRGAAAPPHAPRERRHDPARGLARGPRPDRALYAERSNQPLDHGDLVHPARALGARDVPTPAMFWLSALFGGGQWMRILHPFIGPRDVRLVRCSRCASGITI